MKKRVDWIDVAKFWGMFLIYLGHFGPAAGSAYAWAFSFHVPLFFFLSGCLENYNRRGPLQNLGHKALTTLLPFYLFGLLSLFYEAISSNTAAPLESGLRILLQGGVRNSIAYGAGLWFLSCLFVIQIAFSLIKRIPYKPVALLLCLAAYLAAELLIDPRPIAAPHGYYNVDSACYYLIFYGLGWLTFPFINRLLNETHAAARVLKVCLTAVCFAYSALLFWGRDWLLPMAAVHPLLRAAYGLLLPLPSIWLVVMASHLFQSEGLKRVGRHSLYLCGNEFLIKSLVPQGLALIGLPLAVNTPIQAYLYSLALLALVNIALVPLEKPLLERLQGLFMRRDQ